jgi:hypothetical protein
LSENDFTICSNAQQGQKGNMRLLKYWLIMLSVLFCVSVTAATDVPESDKWDQSQIYPQYIMTSDTIDINLTLTPDNSGSALAQQDDDQQSHFIEVDAPRVIPPRSLLFLADSQHDTEFLLAFELCPPDLSQGRFMVSIIEPRPWFIQTNQKSNPRVSGWKDGNTLYTSLNTYHS